MEDSLTPGRRLSATSLESLLRTCHAGETIFKTEDSPPRRDMCATWAEAMAALVGVRPKFTHEPPRCFRSTRMTRLPASDTGGFRAATSSAQRSTGRGSVGSANKSGSRGGCDGA